MPSEPVPQSPYPDALHSGEAPEPHPLLAPLVGFLGTWVGLVTFSHDGRPFLHYEARAWLLDTDDSPLRPAARESGWWRMQPGGRVEALITQPTGIAEIMVGRADHDTVDLTTHQVALTPTAKEVTATRRRYTLTDDATIDFVHDLAAVGRPLQHHLSARLRRPYPDRLV